VFGGADRVDFGFWNYNCLRPLGSYIPQ
jgi:hypothetical protein